MRIILGLLAIAAVVAAIIMGYNWISGNNNIKIESPNKGETLYTNNVLVRLNPSENTRTSLATTGSNYEVVTYLDGKEVHRGKELTYQLNSVNAGQHQLKIAIADNRTEGVNLNNIALQPGSVDFSVASSAATNSSGANYSTSTNAINSAAVPDTTPIVVQAPPAAPAQPQPTPAPAPALPASGGGGGQLANVATNIDPVNNNLTNSNPVVFSTMNDAPPPPPETPMQSAIRSLVAFYVAAFVVAFGFVFLSIRRRVRRRERLMQ